MNDVTHAIRSTKSARLSSIGHALMTSLLTLLTANPLLAFALAGEDAPTQEPSQHTQQNAQSEPTPEDTLTSGLRDHLRLKALQDHPESEIEITLQSLDPRLNLPSCERWEFTVRSQRSYGRQHVEARCALPVARKLYLSATVNVMQAVPSLARSVQRGEVLTAADIEIQSTPLGQTHGSLLTSLEDAVGQRARRNLPRGTPLTEQVLETPPAVKQGQQVRIQAGQRGLSISAPGEALRTGAVGEQIPVRNLMSKKRVFAWVLGPGVVATRMP